MSANRRGSSFALAVALAISVSISGCTISFGTDQSSSAESPDRPAASAPSPVDPDAVNIEAPGRLAVVGADGALWTMRPDGSSRVELAEGGVPTVSAVQPTWSADGRHLAWVARDASAGNAGGSIVVAGPRGEDPIETPTPFVPYYLSWDPTGTRIAFLGSGGDPDQPVEMGVLDLAGGQPPRAVTSGAPFLYFSWGPDGEHLLAHSGFDTLERIDLSGEGKDVTERPGLFSTPVWSADGRTVVYAERGPDQVQHLVVQTGTRAPRTLAEGRGALSFVLRPDGGAVAYQMLEQDPVTGKISGRAGVRIVDLRTGAIVHATQEAALTFCWSPVGDTLLALVPTAAGPDTVRFGWQVFDGRDERPLPGFHLPTQEVLQEYAPFFTQYALSTTPWAPDGSAIAYASAGPNGLGQIVVEPIDAEPVVVADGVFVTWSPAPA